MRRLLATVIAVAVPMSMVPRTAAAVEPEASEPTAKELYDQGRTDYRVGKYKDAIEAWERSYDLSSAPLLLYNIALAYRGQYDKSGDLEDLRQAATVMKSFITVAEPDPALQAEVGDGRARHAEFVALIEQTESGEAAAAEEAKRAEAEARAKAEKKAKRLRLAGAVTMGVGGGVFLTGAALGTLYIVRSNEFSNQVKKDRRAVQLKLEALDEPPDGVTISRCVDDEENGSAALDYANSMEAADLARVEAACQPAVGELADLGQTRINGKKANTLAIVGFAVIGGIGLAALVAGAVVFAQGNRAMRAGKTARLQLLPQIGGIGPGGASQATGFVLRGEF